MMREKCFTWTAVALLLGFLATSCMKDQDLNKEAKKEFSLNFKALVMGNKTIDPYQDWSTVASIPVEVSVNIKSGKEYNVYIYQTPPLLDRSSAYIGMAKVRSGESKTICVIKPAKVGLLYAACFDDENHAMCKPFVAMASGCSVSFTGKDPTTRTATSDNNWSVPVLSAPNTSGMTSGNLIEMTDAENEKGRDDSSEKHFRITQTYNGLINRLSQFSKQSVYVTGTWNLTFDQRVTHGNTIIVGSGGKIVVPKGFKLTTRSTSSDVANGIIYVMEGGEITGEGSLELTNGSNDYCYNSGTISISDLTLNSGTLYSDGMIGQYNSNKTELTGTAIANGRPGKLINHGYALLINAGGDAFSMQSSANIQVAGELALSEASRMDDGAYTECATLSLNGDSKGGKVLYMGNAAYLMPKQTINIDNFGVWGPSGNGYASNAILKINHCSNLTTTAGVASTYLLDHVELVLPDNYPTIFDDGAIREWDSDVKSYGIGTLSPTYSGYNDIRLLYVWMNGYEGKMLDVGNYQWALDSHSKYNYTWAGATEPRANGIDESHQTCTYSHGPSYSVFGADYSGYHVSFLKTYDNEPSPNYIYYAFEIADDNHDFNYNDLIMRFPTPTDNSDGTFSSVAEIVAVGTTLNTTARLNGEDFGREIHIALGTSTTGNVSKINRLFRDMDTLTFNTPDYQLDKLPFTLYIVNSNDVVNQFSEVEQIIDGAPSFIVVNGDSEGKWFWPLEKMNIGLAYPLFNVWGNSITTAPDWYNKKNAASGKVLTW
jgi:hypothetical protein